MIAKCKAIAHGSNALEYIFREGKLGQILSLQYQLIISDFAGFAPSFTLKNTKLSIFYLASHKYSFNCKKEWWAIFLL